ncbi:cutC copper transporter [Glomus cerebriforme]|uniref:Copper homeostasis protein cutC homolog n=1 Tax=Glomus cerebriforme TaxID=658196 RepID=A0A397STE6_9GLOM|nr:cutC copper transporter [Glomus cerebriforme]
MSKTTPKIEACVYRLENGRASRVELCDNLIEGGTTPSSGMIAAVLERVKIPVMVMIRPRGGDFCYNEDEFRVMRLDIQHAKLLGAHGVVFGILNPDGSVDIDRVSKLVDFANPLKVTFHRAFDMTNDPFKALEDIISIGGIQRILTSGHDSTVLEGLDTIIKLVRQANGRITIMPGGGIRESNIERILSAIELKEMHVSASAVIPSVMEHKISTIHMGRAYYNSEYMINGVSEEKLKKMISAASRGSFK